MRISLKAKLTAAVSLLVLLVVLATSALYVYTLVRQAIATVGRRGEFVANETFSQARSVLETTPMPPGSDPKDFQQLHRFARETLARDAGLLDVLQSAIGYSPTIYYAAITGTDRQVIIHSNPSEIGQTILPVPKFEQLGSAGIIQQLRMIYGPPRVYEIVLPLKLGANPLGDVRIGVSTVLLKADVTQTLREAVALLLAAIVLATLVAALLSFRLLRPLETIAAGVDRMARGEYSKPVEVKRQDEWGILSSKLNVLGEQMRGEKAAFVALRENLDQLFSSLADGLMLFDKQDRLVLATPAASQFLGRPVDQLIHRPAAEVFATGTLLDRHLLHAFASRTPLEWISIEMPAGSPTPTVAVAAQFVEERGERVASLVTLRDARSRAQLEDQIDIAARLAALGKLMSGVAHEVKNPLNAMVLQLEILKAKLSERSQQVKPQLDILSSEVRRLDRVVKTLLEFNRPLTLSLARTEVETLVREVFTLVEPEAAKNHVHLLFEPDGTLPPVRVDRDLIKQALLNLVLNGCQAMPSGGELRVRPRTASHGVELEISDQGVGIPPETRDKVFSLFYTTKPGGTGVGLAMAYRIIQLHNGSLDFTSEVNHGTTFRVSLPC